MARTIRDANLESRAARSRLAAASKPYFRGIEHGLHLGYRKPLTGPGRWLARHYVGAQKYEIETIGSADDFSDADGVAILDYRQAQTLARQRMVARAHAAAGKSGPLTVSAVMADYLAFLETERKSASTARYSISAFILPALGEIDVESLRTDQIRRWLTDIAKSGIRIRTKPGESQRHQSGTDDEEWRRRRKSSANRILRTLKAALNRAWRDGKISSDAAWRRVSPFEDVEAARIRYLTVAEAQRLINACEPDFRKIIEGALQTGCRYGELCRLTVADFNVDTGTVAIRQAKGGKPRHVVLTDEGASFFRTVCVGRAGAEFIFTKKSGEPWARSHQAYPIKSACKRASISPPINFHGLRHTWASHAVMNAVPLLIVAKNLGHASTAMVERHYSHLAPSFVADAIRAGAPRFGTTTESNVKALR